MLKASKWQGMYICLLAITEFVYSSHRSKAINIDEIENLLKEIKDEDHYSSQKNAEVFLTSFNQQYIEKYQKETDANWNYLTDMKPQNGKKLTDVETEVMTWMKEQVKEARKFLRYIPKSESNDKSQFYRMLQLIPVGNAISDDEQVNKKMNELKSQLEEIYGTTKVNGKPLEQLEEDMADPTKTFDEKREIWISWRDAVGSKMRPIYKEFLKNIDIAAKESGYNDLGEAWREEDFGYETDNLIEMTKELYDEILPLYQELHAYVRRKLHDKYPSNFIDLEGPIPAHLLGNMWAQQWEILDDVAPYPDSQPIDITPELEKQNYTPLKMFQTAEAFFTSLGLEPMTDLFWEKSMIVRPKNREVQCHASAEDFYRSGDFRIKMCTHITQTDFTTIHHEMGHIEYFMQYAHQPAIFRSGACAAFHEAIGDTVSLAVNTPKHAAAIGLLSNTNTQPSQNITETDLNYLMKIALEKIAFLPFGYMIDKYRWDVFSGEIKTDHLNEGWWKLRESIQGIGKPVSRSEEDFDPGAKYHIAANVPYIRYFYSHLAQFQFYSAMCDASGHTGPLHRCDFFSSKPAGHLLMKMLSLGRSKPWPEAMKVMTGQKKFSVKPLIRYFQPLLDWIKAENKKNDEYIGWKL